MSERRFAGFTVEALEKLFDENRKVLPTLESIAAELTFRKTKRAKDLELRVGQAIAVFGSLDSPDEEEPWSTYERGLTAVERAVILASPMSTFSSSSGELSLFGEGMVFWRRSEHVLIEAIAGDLEKGFTSLLDASDTYGLAVRMAQFELANKFVTRWPAFALLFRKMLGEKAVPWLPSLYLGAAAFVPGFDLRPDLDEVLRFRDRFVGNPEAPPRPSPG